MTIDRGSKANAAKRFPESSDLVCARLLHGEHVLSHPAVDVFDDRRCQPELDRPQPPSVGNAPGRQVDGFVSTVDFGPTILDAAGIRSSIPMSGSSLLPWLRGETPSSWRDAIFAQLNGVELYYTQQIVMTDSYKYVYNGFDYDELYDLKRDPHEMVNLAFPDVKQARAIMEEGNGLQNSHSTPWPLLPPDLAKARRDLLERMWKFAQEHKDQIFDRYITVAMVPFGPAIEI